MRSSRARSIAVAVVAAGVALSSTACAPGMFNSKKTSACKNIERELRSLSTGTTTTSGNLSIQASRFSQAGSRIRLEGAKAGGSVGSAASRFGNDLQRVADRMRRAQTNPTQSSAALLRSSTQSLQTSARRLGQECDFNARYSF